MDNFTSTLQAEADFATVRARARETEIKQQAMSLTSRLKPFFVEFTFYGESYFWGCKTRTKGVVNGIYIVSIESVHPNKPQKGTILHYVFGGSQRVIETLDEVTAAMKRAVSEAGY